MVEDLTIDHGVSEQRLKTRTGVQVVVKHTHSDRAAALGTQASTCIVARDLINALHYADGRGKKDFPPRNA